jgi:hypothetical protein
MNLFAKKVVNNNTLSLSQYNKQNENYLEGSYNISNYDLSKQWYNSIYCFNKQNIKLLAYLDNSVTVNIESHFNFLSKKNTKGRIDKSSVNKVFVSEPEIKHTNHSVTIFSFLFNKNKTTFLYKLKKLRIKLFNNKKILRTKEMNKANFFNGTSFTNKIVKKELKQNLYELIKFYYKFTKSISSLYLSNNKETKNISNKNDISINDNLYKLLMQLLKEKNKYKIKLVKKTNKISYKGRIIIKKRKFNYLNFRNLNNYKFLLYYQKLSMFNFNTRNWFFNYKNFGISNLLSNTYGKLVDFKIYNLKFMHLNSYIYTKAIELKLLNKKNKKNNLLRIFKKALYNIKFPSLYFLSNRIQKMEHLMKRKSTFLNSLKYKLITGIRLEASGKLNKRKSASRSTFKVKHIGSLKNIYSSYTGLPSSILRGHLKSNIQHTLITSKTTNGSFGLKGWISSF